AMKFENGVAGMNWPSVDVPMALNVRLETMVARFFVTGLPLLSSAWMVSAPFAESPSGPTPNQLRTKSSSAVVAPASMLRNVCFIVLEPLLNDSWYFCACAPMLARRMSLRQVDAPLARKPSDGTTSAVCDAPVSGCGETGVTTLMETGIEVVGAEPSARTFDETPAVP